MQSMKLGNDEQANADVYMIFRVYKLGNDGTNMQIYLDLETLREGGMLHFTSASYNISLRPFI